MEFRHISSESMHTLFVYCMDSWAFHSLNFLSLLFNFYVEFWLFPIVLQLSMFSVKANFTYFCNPILFLISYSLKVDRFLDIYE